MNFDPIHQKIIALSLDGNLPALIFCGLIVLFTFVFFLSLFVDGYLQRRKDNQRKQVLSRLRKRPMAEIKFKAQETNIADQPAISKPGE